MGNGNYKDITIATVRYRAIVADRTMGFAPGEAVKLKIKVELMIKITAPGKAD